MTREFCKALQETFVPHNVVGGYAHRQFNFEQFQVKMLGPGWRKPTLEEIKPIAHQALKRVRNIHYVEECGFLQGAEDYSIVIIPGYQSSRTQHAIAINDMDFDGRTILFSTSWHAAYHITEKQMERYISFAKEFFGMFGRNVPKVLD